MGPADRRRLAPWTAVLGAVRRATASEAHAALDREGRDALIAEEVCEALHGLGPIRMSSVGAARAAAARMDRNDAIRSADDGTAGRRRQLARRHGLSVRQIRRILKDA